jgi:GntR family transcriptional regulator
MILTVKKNSPVPIFKQIIVQIVEALKKGELKPGDRLFPIRVVARELSINPATVAKAYSELEKKGVLVAGGRMGTYISQNLNLKLKSAVENNWQERFHKVVEQCVNSGATKEELLLEIKKFFEQ